MVRNGSGGIVAHITGSFARPDERIKTSWVTPDRVPARCIKNHLCKAGPKACKECQLCEWGKRYLQNEEEKSKQNAVLVTA